MKRVIMALALSALLLSACKEEDLQAALIDEPSLSDQSLLDLQSALNKLKPGSNIRISDSAFIHSSTITVELQSPPSQDPSRDSGRLLGTPEHFSLWTAEGHCIIEYVEGKLFAEVENLPCIAAPLAP